MSDHFQPIGIEWTDPATGKRLMLCLEGHASGWILYKHPDGQWVTHHKTTPEERALIFRPFSITLSKQQTMKPPTLKQLQKQAADWNEKYPIGTPVTRYKLIKPLREPQETKTRSEAWIIGGHSVIVKVEGVSGGVCIESVIPSNHPPAQ